MIVLDTHVWIWWHDDPSRLSRSASELVDGADVLGVSAASCYEARRLAARGRIEFDRPADDWIHQALAHPRVRSIVVDARVAVTAGAIGEAFPGDPLDRMIYASALAHRARLVTRDRRLREADPVTAAW